MVNKDSVWLTTVVPILGIISSTAMFASPAISVWAARRAGKLGALNPLPSAAAVGNCVAWLAYGFVIRNWYIWVENFLGLVAGLVLFLAAYGIGVESLRQRDLLTLVGFLFAILLPVIAALERLVFEDDSSTQKALWGYTANVILFTYYLAPLSTIAHVLRKRDSSSLTLPLCIMNTVNGTLWLIYGLVLSDPFIWVPHGSGAILGALQTALRLIFPQRESERQSTAQLDGNSGRAADGPVCADRSAIKTEDGKVSGVAVQTSSAL